MRVYLSPLKALAVDVERNLRSPLAGIANMAQREGVPVHVPEISVRTGDTPPKERARFKRHPGEILITTPESLYLLLTSRAGEALRSVETVIVDEIHALVPTKRGAHLALSLERLEALCGRRAAADRAERDAAAAGGGGAVSGWSGGAVAVGRQEQQLHVGVTAKNADAFGNDRQERRVERRGRIDGCARDGASGDSWEASAGRGIGR